MIKNIIQDGFGSSKAVPVQKGPRLHLYGSRLCRCQAVSLPDKDSKRVDFAGAITGHKGNFITFFNMKGNVFKQVVYAITLYSGPSTET